MNSALDQPDEELSGMAALLNSTALAIWFRQANHRSSLQAHDGVTPANSHLNNLR